MKGGKNNLSHYYPTNGSIFKNKVVNSPKEKECILLYHSYTINQNKRK